jgi:uncharacterized protein YndB with AHSA1/START domain
VTRVVLWVGGAGAVLAALLLLPLPWPVALVGGRLVDRIDIAAPPERVFAYITAPANWPRWHPASRAVRGITARTPQIGEQVVETFEIAGRRAEATWTTVELDPPRRWILTSTAPGGGSARLVYMLRGNDLGTVWERDLTSRGPNLLFGIINLVELRAVMEADSREALANVKRQLEALPSSP